MQFLSELWMPILVSGAFCFVWSAIAWMVLPHHKSEWRRLPSEPEVLDALRKTATPPGLYAVPFATGADMNRPDVKAAMEKGPVGYLTIGQPGVPNMGKMMAQSVVFFLVTSALAAYVAWHAGLGLGAPYRSVFRVVGTVVTMAYVLGSVPESIWFARPWRSWVYTVADGVMMGMLTAGVFGWLWPK